MSEELKAEPSEWSKHQLLIDAREHLHAAIELLRKYEESAPEYAVILVKMSRERLEHVDTYHLGLFIDEGSARIGKSGPPQ